MIEQSVVLLLTALAHVALGTWVVLRDPASHVHRSFGLLSLSLAAWTASNALVSAYAGTRLGTLAARAAFASAALIPAAFFSFASHFPRPEPRPPREAARIIYLLSAAAFALSPTSLLVQGTSRRDGVLHVAHGPLHPLFAAFLLGTLAYSLALLVRRRRVVRGIERLQLAYVLWGISLTALAGTVSNLLVPLLFRSSRLSPYGPVSGLVMIATIAHAIIRYRFLNLRLVLRRSVTYALTIVLVATLVGAVLLVASPLGVLGPPTRRVLPALAMVLVLTLVFQPLKALVQRSVDRYFFRDPYQYDAAVREISRRVSATLDTGALLGYAQELLHKTLRPEFLAIYLADAASDVFRPALFTRNLMPERPDPLPVIPDLALLTNRPAALLSGTPIQPVPRGPRDPRPHLVIPDSLNLTPELLVPISGGGRLEGFILLGQKLSGDAYVVQDLDLLGTLASQLAVGLGNARLYAQVVLANEYLENILATIDSAVITVSTDSTVTLFNPAAERLTGFKARDVRGEKISILPASVAALLGATLVEGLPRTSEELTVPDASGRLTPVVCSTAPLRRGDGHLLGAVAVFSDLTRIKQLEALKQRADQLASLGALAAGLAHEIKNPLVAIRTFADLLPERFADEDFRTHFSQVVIREIDRIDELITRLRRLATSEAKPLHPIDLRRPYEETLALLRGQLEQASVSVTTSYPDAAPVVLGDHGQLKQLFLNLLVNALEAIGSRGAIAVRFLVRRTDGRGQVAVEVRDTGCGVPSHLVEKVFHPFVTTKPRGSGLGLSICQTIAEAHGATITIANNPDGPGATVVVVFPTPEEPPAPPPRPTGSPTVLGPS